ncbi:MAG: type secretion protein family [Gammaproteobacteria bacterium]|nr:type secretion protein family [Gammaproteobacteria bacterium]
MAGANGQPPDHLTAARRPTALEQLAAEPHRFTLFAALRLLEQSFGARPRLGEGRKAADDAVRLGQAPHLAFAPSDVCAFDATQDERARLEQYSFGMFGPNGVLPQHLTEYAYEWRRQREDATFVDFLNAFQHRLVSLFYRAWANADPATSFDRPESDRFATYVGALIGLAPESARNRDAAPDFAKLSRAGHLGPQIRSAEGLEVILADYFRLTVELRPFVGAWMEVPEALYCRLGGPRELALLGSTTTLGGGSWQCQHKFELVLGPLTLASFKNFLPGARGLQELHALVRFYTNDEWTWQLRLLLRDVEVPGVQLGKTGQLGWTTWLGGRRTTADDVLLQEPVSVPAARAA